MTPRRMDCPAPRRQWVPSAHGYTSQPWGISGIIDVLSYGGWFVQGAHDFADRKASALATGGARAARALLEAVDEQEEEDE